MKLRQKSLLLITLPLIAVTGLMLGVFHFVSQKNFDRMEEDSARRTVQRAMKLLQSEREDLARSVRDYGAWDTMTAATTANDATFFRDSLPYEVGANLRWDIYAAFRNDGQIVASSEMIRADQSVRPVSPEMLDELRAHLDKLRSEDKLSPTHHLMLLRGEPYIVAGAPVRQLSERTAPVGLLVAARRLDGSAIARLARMTDVSLQLAPVSSIPRIANTASPSAIFAVRHGPGAVAGCVVLKGATGEPVGLLQAVFHSEIRKQGLNFTLILMGVVVIGEILVYVLIDRLFLSALISRLSRLSSGLDNVQRSGDLSARLRVEGDDEITRLEEGANRLLASVESSQSALERVNAEMQQHVADRTAALAQANAALEADIAQRIKAEQEGERLREQLMRAQKMEAVGTLAGGIAHDFNNILAGILGHTQLIRSDLPPDSSSQRHLQHVVLAAERAAGLVKQILAFSRQTQGERVPVSVGQIAREALSLLRAALPSGIEIRCQVDTAADVVEADATQLHQVFMNLGANAGHAMGSRGGELAVRITRVALGEHQQDAAHPLPAGSYIRIAVRDTGCGMTPAVMKRIFDPFFSTKAVNEGTGLGLAVVHGIVLDHGGSIEVESEPGRGTCFHILLPAADGQAGESSSRHANPLRGTERILLVDDEELVLGVLAKTLERLGYQVVAEPTSLGALERFTRAPDCFDLVITDQTMPQMSGLDLSKAVQAIRPDIPVILATGFSPEVSGRDAGELGLAGIVGKPIDFAELTGIMRVELEKFGRPRASDSV